jgi:hypothetical protein
MPDSKCEDCYAITLAEMQKSFRPDGAVAKALAPFLGFFGCNIISVDNVKKKYVAVLSKLIKLVKIS